MIYEEDTNPVPPGVVWVCNECGSRANTKSGKDAEGNPTVLDRAYDQECCARNARLCVDPPNIDETGQPVWEDVVDDTE
jgi:hypothetical protein